MPLTRSLLTDQQWSQGYTDAYRVSLTLGLVMQEHGVRHYDPTLGRWQQYEPLAGRLASWSAYSYAFNDFTNLTDPSGYIPGLRYVGTTRVTPEKWNEMDWWEREFVSGGGRDFDRQAYYMTWVEMDQERRRQQHAAGIDPTPTPLGVPKVSREMEKEQKRRRLGYWLHLGICQFDDVGRRFAFGMRRFCFGRRIWFAAAAGQQGQQEQQVE